VPTDFSCLPQMGEITLFILGAIVVAVIFIKRGLPKYNEYKKELAKISAFILLFCQFIRKRKVCLWKTITGEA
jgi:hypothetical protein